MYRTPDEDLPVAPGGVQKAPGVTIGAFVAAGEPEALGEGKGVAVAVFGVPTETLTISDFVGLITLFVKISIARV